MKRAFKVKEKTFFLVSQVLSFRHKKQTSKNVAETTFKKAFDTTICKITFIYWLQLPQCSVICLE